MNKILILLIGFAMTQSIQTKQIEVTISDFSSGVNLFENSDLIGEEYYVKSIGLESLNIPNLCTELQGFANDGLRFTLYDERTYQMLESNYPIMPNFGIIHIDCYTYHSYPTNTNIVITNYLPNIMICDGGYDTEFNVCSTDVLDYISPITFTFWVTGMFEGDLMFDTGDLNGDGEVNVVDVVVLVNSILGIG